MKEYLITLEGKAASKTLHLGYRNGLLAKVEIPAHEQYSDTDLTWLLNWLRWQITESQLHDNVRDTTKVVKFSVFEIEQDLSFDHFWEVFDNKVGNRKRARKLWDALTDQQRIAVFINIRKYKYFLSINTNQQQLYPETYLSQERWTNEYKI